MTKGFVNANIDAVIKERLFAECRVRTENDHDTWTVKRLLTQYALRTLPPLGKEDEQRIKALCNGHPSTPARGGKKPKVKPAAA